MSKRRLTALIMSLVLAVTVGAFLLSACDDGSSPLGKGVTRPEPVYTNNLDKTEGENLALSATISASSAADGVAALTDGDTTTAWTAESSSDEYIEIAFELRFHFLVGRVDDLDIDEALKLGRGGIEPPFRLGVEHHVAREGAEELLHIEVDRRIRPLAVKPDEVGTPLRVAQPPEERRARRKAPRPAHARRARKNRHAKREET